MSPTTLANSPKTTIDTEYYYKAILENGHWLELEKGPITSQYIKERSPTPVPVYSSLTQEDTQIFLAEIWDTLGDMAERLESLCWYERSYADGTAMVKDLVGLSFIPEEEEKAWRESKFVDQSYANNDLEEDLVGLSFIHEEKETMKRQSLSDLNTCLEDYVDR